MKVNKHASVLDNLKLMMDKQAAEKQANHAPSGVPGKDTNYTSVSSETDHTNKNEVGPEKLNDKQKYEQKPSSDGSEPSKPGAKTAEELAAEKAAAELAEKDAAAKVPLAKGPAATAAPAAPISEKAHAEKAPMTAVPEKMGSVKELGEEVLNAINKLANSATGIPGKDTDYTRVSDDTDKTNKNEVGPEKLNDKQKYEQKPSTDKSEPSTPGAKTAEEEAVEKIGAFEWGRQLAVEFLKEAFTQEPEIYKQAGRRDFEQLIAQASAQLEEQQKSEKVGSDMFDQVYLQEKQAEEQGAAYFTELYKRAQYEVEFEKSATARKSLEEKVAQLEKDLAEKAILAKQASEALAEKAALLQKKADDEKRAQEISAIVSMVSDNLFDRLKNEAAR